MRRIRQGREHDLLAESPGGGWGCVRDHGQRSLGLVTHEGLVYEGGVDGEGILFLWRVVGHLLYDIAHGLKGQSCSCVASMA